jgi:hypothetical protein
LAQIAQRRVHPAGTPLSLDDARRLVEGYISYYNNVRRNSAIGYITPKDMLAGRQQEIHPGRDRKLEEGENSGRFVGSWLHEARRRRVSGQRSIGSTGLLGRSDLRKSLQTLWGHATISSTFGQVGGQTLVNTTCVYRKFGRLSRPTASKADYRVSTSMPPFPSSRIAARLSRSLTR